MDLNPLREETLTTVTTTAVQDSATIFGLHAGTEAELTLARTLGGLIGALHGRKILGRIGSGRMTVRFGSVNRGIEEKIIFLRFGVAPEKDSFYFDRLTGFHGVTLGVIAQLVERLNGIEEVWGSTPHGSTKRSFSAPVLLRPLIPLRPLL